MLQKSVREVYNACRCISFYECVYEYFQYCEKISTDFVNATNHSEAVLAELWEIYLKYEYLGIENQKEIEELLNVYVMERGQKACEAGQFNEKMWQGGVVPCHILYAF